MPAMNVQSALTDVVHAENVELILKGIGNRHGSESQEVDQPDYDSVASDEDTEREPASGKEERTKVARNLPEVYFFIITLFLCCRITAT